VVAGRPELIIRFRPTPIQPGHHALAEPAYAEQHAEYEDADHHPDLSYSPTHPDDEQPGGIADRQERTDLEQVEHAMAASSTCRLRSDSWCARSLNQSVTSPR
jgi:hypothetical protein